jgi:hypothetical protein
MARFFYFGWHLPLMAALWICRLLDVFEVERFTLGFGWGTVAPVALVVDDQGTIEFRESSSQLTLLRNGSLHFPCSSCSLCSQVISSIIVITFLVYDAMLTTLNLYLQAQIVLHQRLFSCTWVLWAQCIPARHMQIQDNLAHWKRA